MSPAPTELTFLGPEKSCGGADVLLVVHDVSNRCAFTLSIQLRSDHTTGM